jgi:threonine-phosphate decarboxylase
MLARLWDIPGLRPAWPARERPEGMPPPPNSILVSLTETEWTAPAQGDALAGRGLLVRDCSNLSGLEIGALLTGPDQLVATRGHLRLAARLPAENDRLLDELEALLASEPTGPS